MLASASHAIGSPSPERFVLTALGALFAYYLLKNLFLVAVDVFQYRSLATVQSTWARRLMGSYLNRPYAYHLQVNSAQLIRNVSTEVGTVLYYVLVPAASLLAEAFVIGSLLLLLVALDPVIAGFFLASGAVVLVLFYRTFRERNYRIGKDLQDSSADMIRHAKEGFGGIKEIKVMGRESFFEASFGVHVATYTRAWGRSLILYKLPTHVIEVVFVSVFTALLVFLTLRHESGSAFPLLAVYAAAAFRLVPSLNRIVTSMNLIKQGTASAVLLSSELLRVDPAVAPAPREAAMPFANEIRVEQLVFRHEGADRNSLDGISLRIGRGEMVGFAGRSGSGKTTLIDCIIGLLPPSSGRILVDGRDIHAGVNAWQREIGYIPQHIYLIDDSLRRNIALGLQESEIDPARLDAAIRAAQLSELVASLPDGVDTFVGEHGVRLSGGQRQRIGIARALFHDPTVLVMDEATSALDAETEQAIVRTIAGLKGSRTILIIAHRLATIEDCDRVIVLDDGRIVQD